MNVDVLINHSSADDDDVSPAQLCWRDCALDERWSCFCDAACDVNSLPEELKSKLNQQAEVTFEAKLVTSKDVANRWPN